MPEDGGRPVRPPAALALALPGALAMAASACRDAPQAHPIQPPWPELTLHGLSEQRAGGGACGLVALVQNSGTAPVEAAMVSLTYYDEGVYRTIGTATVRRLRVNDRRPFRLAYPCPQAAGVRQIGAQGPDGAPYAVLER